MIILRWLFYKPELRRQFRDDVLGLFHDGVAVKEGCHPVVGIGRGLPFGFGVGTAVGDSVVGSPSRPFYILKVAFVVQFVRYRLKSAEYFFSKKQIPFRAIDSPSHPSLFIRKHVLLVLAISALGKIVQTLQQVFTDTAIAERMRRACGLVFSISGNAMITYGNWECSKTNRALGAA
jgi:hypothetical protein